MESEIKSMQLKVDKLKRSYKHLEEKVNNNNGIRLMPIERVPIREIPDEDYNLEDDQEK